MRDGTPPGRGSRGSGRAVPGGPLRGASSPRGGSPAGLSPQRSGVYEPYRPYGPPTGARLPAPGMSAVQMPIPGAQSVDWAAASGGAQRHRLGVAIFHDGNPGHLWRGEVASRLGESVLGIGIVMWLAALTQSPLLVAAALGAIGLPYLLVGPLTARLENAHDPAGALKWCSRIRFVCSLGVIAMHYRTIVPVLLALLFLVSFCGRLREAWRVAALRVCLQPGEPEHVANDVQIGATIAAILGPLLATVLYVLLGERILLVSIGAALLFLISANSESFLDPIPPIRRAYLLARPETVDPDGEPLESLEPLDDDAYSMEDREANLPEWYQQGPTTAGETLGELRAGLGLAGSTNPATAAVLALTALALVGGAFSALEVFYVVDAMRLPSFYLGPLVAVECAGLAVGALLAGEGGRGGMWRFKLVGGIIGSGCGLMLLAWLPIMPIALVVAAGLGVANAVAVSGSQLGLRLGFDPVARRAIARAQRWVSAVAGLVGLVFVLYLNTTRLAPGLSQRTAQLLHRLPSYQVDQLIALLGMALTGGVVGFGILLVFARRQRTRHSLMAKTKVKRGTDKKSKATKDEDGEASEYMRAAPSGDDWGEADDAWSGEYASAERPRYDETGYGPATGYGDAAVADDTYDDLPPRNRRGRSGRQLRW